MLFCTYSLTCMKQVFKTVGLYLNKIICLLTVISTLPETARALLSPSNAYVLGIQSACATENRVIVIVYVSNQNRLLRKCLFNSRFLICSGRAAKSHIELISKRCSSFGQLHHIYIASEHRQAYFFMPNLSNLLQWPVNCNHSFSYLAFSLL